MACVHTSRSLKGRMLRQKGHLKSATAPEVEVATPLWMYHSQKLRSSAGPRRRCEHRRVHSGQSRRRQQLALWSTTLLQEYISQRVSFSSGHAPLEAFMLLAPAVVASCASAGSGPAQLSLGAPWRQAAAAGIGCCGSGQMESLPKVLGGSYGGGLSKMDRDAGLRPASA